MARNRIAEVVVTHRDLALTPTLEAVPDLDVRIESQPATAPETPVLFYSVQTPEFQPFETALADDHTVAEWERIAEFNDRRIYRVQLSLEVKVLTPAITDHGVRVLNASNADGGWYLRLHTPNKECLAQVQTYCRQEDVHFQIEKLYQTGAESEFAGQARLSVELTDRQREIAQTVTHMGYFEQDGASAAEVADHLDIARSTLSTHLRRITATLFHHHFQDE